MLLNISDTFNAHDEDSEHGTSCACGNHHNEDKNDTQKQLTRCFIGGIFVLNSFIASFFSGTEYISIFSAIIGALYLSFPIMIAAVKDIIKGEVYMNELVTLAILAAFAQQSYQTAGIIAFFMLITITIEQKTAIGARASIESLIKLTPRLARKIIEGAKEQEVDVFSLVIGDVCRIRPGENFPADGTIIKGNTTVNESTITGESLPKDKAYDTDTQIYAGTENLTGVVDVRVTGIGKDTTLGKVRELLETAGKTKLPVMRMVDKYVGFYTPTILMIAAVVWFFTQDMTRVIAILVVACPCTIVLATPSATIAAIAAAARLGILIKNVTHIELAAKIKSIVFDKTGTLTEGNLEVARLVPAKGTELSDLLKVAASAESHSNHPAAKAMRKLAKEANVKLMEPNTFEEVHGKGIIADIEGTKYRIGRKTWLEELGIDTEKCLSPEHKDAGLSIVYAAKDEQIMGYIAMQDAIRGSSKSLITKLKDLGITDCSMVTGDNESVANRVGKELNISTIRHGCLPHEKVNFVDSIKTENNLVAVVGDGINDAPALAAGDIGIAMGAMGSDIAVNSASIALMNTDLSRIPLLISISKQTRIIINQNLLAGLFFMIIGLYLSSMGILPPAFAAAIHSISALVVLFNSARLVRTVD
ncbi:MAG: cation-translocating P-type ATPase [Verrucomicrobiota bacterium]|nr:cation-translocating P-type ATPase [Verrucomicrobiota bacterium]